MSKDNSLDFALDSDICMTQERFCEAMETRLAEMPLGTKERYFAVLSLLVAKLEDPSKELHQILHEMVAEAATIVMAEIQR